MRKREREKESAFILRRRCFEMAQRACLGIDVLTAKTKCSQFLID